LDSLAPSLLGLCLWERAQREATERARERGRRREKEKRATLVREVEACCKLCVWRLCVRVVIVVMMGRAMV